LLYFDRANYNKLTLRKFDGYSWNLVASPVVIPGIINAVSLYIENGIPYVVYSQTGAFSNANVMKCTGGYWSDVASTGNSVSDVSLFVKNQDVFVAYTNGYDGNKVTVEKLDGFSWSIIGAYSFSAGQVMNMKLIENEGELTLGFIDVGNGTVASVMKFNGINWIYKTFQAFHQGQHVFHLSVIIIRIYSWHLLILINRIKRVLCITTE